MTLSSLTSGGARQMQSIATRVYKPASRSASVSRCATPSDAGKYSFVRCVGHDLDRRDQPEASHVTDAVERLERAKAAQQPPTRGLGPGDELFTLDDVDVGQRDCATRRMPGIRERVHPSRTRRDVFDRVADLIGHADSTKWDVAARNALGKLHDVRLDAVTLQAEPSPGSPEPGNHLVRDQQHVVSVTDLPNAREVVWWRNDDAARALHRFGNEGCDRIRAFTHDGRFKLVCGGDTEADAGIR